MRSVSSILINAPLDLIVEKAADLEQWPTFLPHYRFNRFLSRLADGRDGGIVQMAAYRTGIPLEWVSIFSVDRTVPALYFEHLKPTTRGMKVVWNFYERPDGVFITIAHDFHLDWPIIGDFVANQIIGEWLIDHIAPKTLAGLKKLLEK